MIRKVSDIEDEVERQRAQNRLERKAKPLPQPGKPRNNKQKKLLLQDVDATDICPFCRGVMIKGIEHICD